MIPSSTSHCRGTRSDCDHKFVGPRKCAKCGVHIDELRAAASAELEELLQQPPATTRQALIAGGA
jgi:hypothetical protein